MVDKRWSDIPDLGELVQYMVEVIACHVVIVG